MQRIVMLTVSVMIWSVLSGCDRTTEPEKSAAKSAHASDGDQTVDQADSGENRPPWTTVRRIQQTVEVGCAKCMFDMEGVESHELAVMIDGKPYLVSGVYIEPTESGLCEEVQQAQVDGRIMRYDEGIIVEGQKETFAAESIQLQE